jgi:sigma-B regulation protein RsbU (phosphoserine phosphatase)
MGKQNSSEAALPKPPEPWRGRRSGDDRRSGHGRRASDVLETQVGLMTDIAREFSSSRDIHATMRAAVERLTRYVGSVGGALFLVEENGTGLVCAASCGPVELEGLKLAQGEGIVGRCVATQHATMVRDAMQDPGFASEVDENTGFTTRSILCAPLLVQGECLGAIELVNKLGAARLFDEHDLAVLEAMAGSAALAITNARMAAGLIHQERTQRELEVAAEIQRSLLPDRLPGAFPVVGINLPAFVVSGDFYDYLTLEDGRVCFALGDVAGKGLNAALLMAKTASLFRCLAKFQSDPGRLLSLINEEIHATTTRGMFVTMVVGVLDRAAGLVSLANAGHEPALLRSRNGEFSSIPADAPPIGIASDFDASTGFPRIDIDLAGGALYLFTDGVTEARQPDGTMFGADGFQHLVDELDGLALGRRVDVICERIAALDPHDDMTILAVDLRAQEEPDR